MNLSFHNKSRQKNLFFKKASSSTFKGYVLFMYISDAIKAWKNGNFQEQNFNSHSMHWESIEIVRLLNISGYDVDVCPSFSDLDLKLIQKYSHIIDETGNLENIPLLDTQKRIYYATGCHWLFHNYSEWDRLNSFRMRHGISLFPQRQVKATISDRLSNVITYFGNSFQRDLFPDISKTQPLSISSSFIPAYRSKAIAQSKHNFIWLGSRGYIHKGLDIVLEVFKKLPALSLHICSDLRCEPDFWEWYQSNFEKCSNINYYGFMDVSSPTFIEIAENCISTISCSCAEGGGGAVIQAMQFGCIPITNKNTAVNGAEFGVILEGDTADELLISLYNALVEFSELNEITLKELSDRVRIYANESHSKKAFSDSFLRMITIIN